MVSYILRPYRYVPARRSMSLMKACTFVRRGPVEVAVLVGHVAVQRGDRRVDQSGRGEPPALLMDRTLRVSEVGPKGDRRDTEPEEQHKRGHQRCDAADVAAGLRQDHELP